MDSKFLVEILTPRQDTQDLEGDLGKFADKYHRILTDGHVVSVPDNPMGNMHFQLTEIIEELDLTVDPGKVLLHINTFHTREHLDGVLKVADKRGIKELLVISGDGSERLPKLAPGDIGATGNTVTSVELLRYIHGKYPNRFRIGVAFNPYEPQDHEIEKMRRKVEAGAAHVITQPLLKRMPEVDGLKEFGLPLTIGVWMSKKIHLLSECVGYAIPEDTHYDPMAKLKELMGMYPKEGVYFSLLGFKTQLPLLKMIEP